jgi:hypothetical protein
MMTENFAATLDFVVGHTGHERYRELVTGDAATWTPKVIAKAEAIRRGEVPARTTANMRSRRRAAGPGTTLAIRAHLAGGFGYGQIAEWLGRELDRRGQRVAFVGHGIHRDHFPLQGFVDERLADAVDPGMPAIQLTTPTTPLAGDTARVASFSMWESSRIPRAAAENLSRARVVMVPCEHNAEAFIASGVTAPIRVVPLGIDPSVYDEMDGWDPTTSTPFVFGAAGRTAHGGIRKNLDFVASCFSRVADRMPDATLEIKVWPDCTVDTGSHPRIRLIRTPMTPAEMAVWYRGLDVYVTASRGEGFGLQTAQAMAVGRPAIVVPWSGTMEFWDQDCGWPLDYALAPAGEFYSGDGQEWAVPTEESLCAAMLHAYANRDEVKAKGKAAAERMRAFPWSRTGDALESVLREFGLWPEPKPIPAPSPLARAYAKVTRCPERVKVGSGCGCQRRCKKLDRVVGMAECLACVGGTDR